MDEFNDTLNNAQQENEDWKTKAFRFYTEQINIKQQEAIEKEQKLRKQEHLENIRREQEKEEEYRRQLGEQSQQEPQKTFLERLKERQEEKKNKKRILEKQKKIEIMHQMSKEIGVEVIMSDAATMSLELEDENKDIIDIDNTENEETAENKEAVNLTPAESMQEAITTPPVKKFRFREDMPIEEKKAVIPQGFIDFKNDYRKLYVNGVPVYGISDMENAMSRIARKCGITKNLIPSCIIIFGHEFESLVLFFSLQSFQQMIDSLHGNDKFGFTCMYTVFADSRMAQHIYTPIYGDESRLRYISEKIVGPITKYMDTKRGSVSGTDFCNQILIPNIPELAGLKKIMCAD